MADDIDIEEHDVMNNSYVKGMFPDLAIVKTETLDEHDVIADQETTNAEETTNIEETINTEETTNTERTTNTEEINNTEKTSVGKETRTPEETNSKKAIDTEKVSQEPSPQPSTSASEAIPDSTTDLEAKSPPRVADSPHMVTSTQEDSLSLTPSTCLFLAPSNCVILDSKPTGQLEHTVQVDDDIDLQHCCSAAVELQNWGPFLANSRSYCSECEILFATVNAFDAHKMQAHSFLVAVERPLSPEISPEMPPEISPEVTVEARKSKQETKCVMCTLSFDDQDALIQHFYVHLTESLQCSICKKKFKSKQLLSEHKMTHAENSGKDRDSVSKARKSTATLRDSTPKSRKSTSKPVEVTLNTSEFTLKQRESTSKSRESTPKSRESTSKPVEVTLNTSEFTLKQRESTSKSRESTPKSRESTSIARESTPITSAPTSKAPVSTQKSRESTSIARASTPKTSESTLMPSAPISEPPETTSVFSESTSMPPGFVSYPRKAFKIPEKMGLQCHCGCIFKKSLRLEQHCEFFHKEVPPSAYKLVPLVPKCEICLRTFSNMVYYNRHVQSIHLKIDSSKEYQKFLVSTAKVKLSMNDTPQLRTKKFMIKINEAVEKQDKQEEKIVIPKSTLFKCSKCSVHFINGSIAAAHFRNCAGIAEFVFDCAKCHLSLKQSSEAAHAKQHRFGDHFKVHNIDGEDIRPKTLAQCPKCCVQYSEQSFWAHLDDCEGKASNKFRCSLCELDIDVQIKDAHEYAHKSLDYKPDDFIIIDYGQIGVDGTIEATQNANCGYQLYLCKTCKCFITFRKHKTSNCHYNGTCKNIRKATCLICGLVVTEASLNRHLEYHKRIDSYNLSNFKFFTLVENKPIWPIPEYATCRMCQIRFHTKALLSEHNCKKTEYKTCKICNHKFTEIAYKLHTPYHKLGVADDNETPTVRNEEGSGSPSLDIKMNYCSSCKYFFHKIRRHYDRQGKCVQSTGCPYICHICGLLCGNGGKTHKQYHDKYGKFTLNDISFYRMPDRKLIKPPIPVYHACDNCNIHFCTKREVREHQCVKEPFKKCDICDIKLSDEAYDLHMPFHNYGDDYNSIADAEDDKTETGVAYDTKDNILAFYTTGEGFEEEDGKGAKKFLFYVCRICKFSVMLKSDVKYHRCKTSQPNKRYTCKKCGLLLAKSMSVKHNMAHETDPSFTRENFEIIPFSPLESGVRKIVLFKCKTCDECMMDYTIREHYNKPCVDKKRDACDKCNLKFTNENTHKNLHRRHANMRDNVDVTVIKSLQDYVNKVNKTSNKVYQCRQCKTILFSCKTAEQHKVSCRNIEEKLIFCNKCRLDIPDNEKSMKDHDACHAERPDFVWNSISLTQFCPAKYKPRQRARRPNEKYTMYKCLKCQTCFKSPTAIQRHGQNKRCNAMPRKCEICGLLIAKNNVDRHNERHELLPDLIQENIRLIPFDEGKVVSDDETEELEVDINSEPNEVKAKQVDGKFKLFLCKKCDVHCISPQSVSEHRSENHEFSKDIFPCKVCGLKFSKCTLLYHTKVHHNQYECKLEDFIIKEIGPYKKYLLEKAGGTPDSSAAKKSDDNEHVDENRNSDSDFEMPKNSASRKRTRDGKLVESTAVEVYQCICKLNFMCRMDAKEHLKDCKGIESNSGLSCSKCKLMFPANDLVKHSLKHHSSQSDFKPKIVEVNPLNDVQYRCGICYTHFVNEASLGSHVKNCSSDNVQGRKCAKCNLLVHITMMEQHKTLHSKLSKNNESKTDIITYNAPNNEEDDPSNKYTLYKCNICDVHFLTENHRDLHLEDANTVHSPENYSLCETCNLIIAKDCFDEHHKKHHSTHKSESNIRKDIETRGNSVKILSLKQNTKKQQFLNDRDRRLDKNLYYCDECQIHLLREHTYSYHHSKPGHGGGKKSIRRSCPNCGLNFTGISFLSHMRVHHEKMNLKLEDFIIHNAKATGDTSDANKSHASEEKESNDEMELTKNNEPDTASSADLEDAKEIQNKPQGNPQDNNDKSDSTFNEKHEVGKPSTKRQSENKETEDLKGPTASPKPGPKSKKIDAQDNNDKSDSTLNEKHEEGKPSIKRQSENKEMEDLKGPTALPKPGPKSKKTDADPKSKKIDDKIVYYRCKSCNVLFLNKKNCLEHVSPHSPMPEYDFLECKLCHRNFEVDALKPHMAHHKNDLSYEAVRIVEYEVDDASEDARFNHNSNGSDNDANIPSPTESSNCDAKEPKEKPNETVEDMDIDEVNSPDNEDNSDEQSKQSSKQGESDDENDSANKFSCHMCKKKYKTARARDFHVSLDHLDEEQQCPFCDRTFNLSILNDIHLCMSGDMFKCCICGNFFQQLLLEAHAREGCLKD